MRKLIIMSKKGEKPNIEELKERFKKTVFQEIYNGQRKSSGLSSTPIQTNSGDPPDSPANMPRKLKFRKRE